MVIHDYECEECGYIFEDLKPYEERTAQCPKCDGTSKRIVTASKIQVFQPQRFEELGDDAPLISSKAELARECQKRGLVSRYLEDSYRRHGKRKEY